MVYITYTHAHIQLHTPTQTEVLINCKIYSKQLTDHYYKTEVDFVRFTDSIQNDMIIGMTPYSREFYLPLSTTHDYMDY